MPIYEYRCQACGHSFEALVFGAELPNCPSCESRDLEKQFSAFAVGSGGASGNLPSCATGGG